MKRIIYKMMMLAALTLAWGCGSSDDNGQGSTTIDNAQKWTKTLGAADWRIDWTASDPVPDWTAPDPSNYENWMILMVRLQPELAKYSTENDLMAVFIGNEIRALAQPAISIGNTKDVSFILKIHGNEVSDKDVLITLKYYCSQLRQTFVVSGSQPFVPEWVYGVEETFMPNLLVGCMKYPVQMPLTLQLPRLAQDILEPEIGDQVAVMVDGECRGVTTIDEHLFLAPYKLTVYAKQEGEKGRVYYYNARENAIWDTGTVIPITPTAQTVNIGY